MVPNFHFSYHAATPCCHLKYLTLHWRHKSTLNLHSQQKWVLKMASKSYPETYVHTPQNIIWHFQLKCFYLSRMLYKVCNSADTLRSSRIMHKRNMCNYIICWSCILTLLLLFTTEKRNQLTQHIFLQGYYKWFIRFQNAILSKVLHVQIRLIYMKRTVNSPSLLHTLQMFYVCPLGHTTHVQAVVELVPHNL
jgi:hypothetical protein